jgi:chloride channel 3/4/5
MKGFLGFRTLLIKSMALPLAIGSGLSVGKEGPSVHYAVCTGNVVSRMFGKYRRNASKTREILSACAAAGVAVAFGSPIGGVLFSLEEISSYFPLKTMWRSYFCALVATAVLAAVNPFRTGQLVMFQVRYDRSWHFFELVFFVMIGIFGGLYGALVIKWNLRVQQFRKKYLAQYAVLETVVLATVTAVVCYPNSFLRIEMTESMEILFMECEGAGDYNGLCDRDKRLGNVLSLVLATVIRLSLVLVTYGCKVPAGIFVPSMAIGALFGRTVGIVVQALHEASPGSIFFAACKPDEPCITPGTYAFLGAAAALSGIMHITITVVVIMFELTGALTYILPTMIVVGVTKMVSEMFGKGGIADRMIWFSGFPFLDNKEEHNFGVPVSHVMRTTVRSLPVSGMTLGAVEAVLAEDQYQGFPVVEDRPARGTLVGYIGRTELAYAISRARRDHDLPASVRCSFSPTPAWHAADDAGGGMASSSSGLAATPASVASSFSALPAAFAAPGAGITFSPSGAVASIDFGRYVDATPVTVHPRLSLETVMELFRKIGPRVILVEHHGRLVGLVTPKDCLRYQFKVEAAENPRDDSAVAESHARVYARMEQAAGAGARWLARVSRGRIRLGEGGGGGGGGGGYGAGDAGRRSADGRILDGDEDVGEESDAVELAAHR